MKRISTSAATAILLACTVSLGAQTSSATKPSSSTSTQSGSAARENSTPASQRRSTRRARSSTAANPPQEITLTGCLQSGDHGASASNAATGASNTRRAQANAIPTFILSNASGGSGPSSAEPRSVGTSGNQSTNSSSASLSGTGSGSYILQGLDLSRQMGQQVEVTGTMMPAPTARAGRNRASRTSAATTDADTSIPRIRVTSVRMLSEHCSNQ